MEWAIQDSMDIEEEEVVDIIEEVITVTQIMEVIIEGVEEVIITTTEEAVDMDMDMVGETRNEEGIRGWMIYYLGVISRSGNL